MHTTIYNYPFVSFTHSIFERQYNIHFYQYYYWYYYYKTRIKFQFNLILILFNLSPAYYYFLYPIKFFLLCQFRNNSTTIPL